MTAEWVDDEVHVTRTKEFASVEEANADFNATVGELLDAAKPEIAEEGGDAENVVIAAAHVNENEGRAFVLATFRALKK